MARRRAAGSPSGRGQCLAHWSREVPAGVRAACRARPVAPPARPARRLAGGTRRLANLVGLRLDVEAAFLMPRRMSRPAMALQRCAWRSAAATSSAFGPSVSCSSPASRAVSVGAMVVYVSARLSAMAPSAAASAGYVPRSRHCDSVATSIPRPSSTPAGASRASGGSRSRLAAMSWPARRSSFSLGVGVPCRTASVLIAVSAVIAAVVQMRTIRRGSILGLAWVATHSRGEATP